MTDVLFLKKGSKSSVTFIVAYIFIFNHAFSKEIKIDSLISYSVFAFPYASFQPETSWSGGLAGGYYFKSKDLSRISSVTGSAEYTLKNQFTFNLTPKIYLNRNSWLIAANVNFRNYPDYFYGVGNKITHIKQLYISRNLSFSFQPQYRISKEIYVGSLIDFRNENISIDSTFNGTKEIINQQYGTAGWTEYSQINFGLQASFDSRDNQFYPQKGFFVKTIWSTSSQMLGSNYSINTISLDIRQFIPIFTRDIIAWQVYCKGVVGKDKVPFQLLPTPGGLDMLRGFRQGMFRDNWLMLLQTEYRIPIYKKLKAAIFCSAGDVFNSDKFQTEKLKIAYGMGLRYRLNDARVHLRFDIAKNNYGDKPQFYLTASEAF